MEFRKATPEEAQADRKDKWGPFFAALAEAPQFINGVTRDNIQSAASYRGIRVQIRARDDGFVVRLKEPKA